MEFGGALEESILEFNSKSSAAMLGDLLKANAAARLTLAEIDTRRQRAHFARDKHAANVSFARRQELLGSLLEALARKLLAEEMKGISCASSMEELLAQLSASREYARAENSARVTVENELLRKTSEAEGIAETLALRIEELERKLRSAEKTAAKQAKSIEKLRRVGGEQAEQLIEATKALNEQATQRAGVVDEVDDDLPPLEEIPSKKMSSKRRVERHEEVEEDEKKEKKDKKKEKKGAAEAAAVAAPPSSLLFMPKATQQKGKKETKGENEKEKKKKKKKKVEEVCKSRRTVMQLRDELKSLGLNTSGRKAELIARLEAFMSCASPTISSSEVAATEKKNVKTLALERSMFDDSLDDDDEDISGDYAGDCACDDMGADMETEIDVATDIGIFEPTLAELPNQKPKRAARRKQRKKRSGADFRSKKNHEISSATALAAMLAAPVLPKARKAADSRKVAVQGKVEKKAKASKENDAAVSKTRKLYKPPDTWPAMNLSDAFAQGGDAAKKKKKNKKRGVGEVSIFANLFGGSVPKQVGKRGKKKKKRKTH